MFEKKSCFSCWRVTFDTKHLFQSLLFTGLRETSAQRSNEYERGVSSVRYSELNFDCFIAQRCLKTCLEISTDTRIQNSNKSTRGICCHHVFPGVYGFCMSGGSAHTQGEPSLLNWVSMTFRFYRSLCAK